MIIWCCNPFPAVQLGGFVVQVKSQYKYLGVVLSQSLDSHAHVKYIIGKATVSSILIQQVCKKSTRPSFPTINKLVQAVLIPKVVYGIPFYDLPVGPDFTKLKGTIISPLLTCLRLPQCAS